MKKMIRKIELKMMNVEQLARAVMTNNSGEGFVDSAVFSVLHCYDRIATIVKQNNTMIKIRHIVNEFVKRSKVILVDQRGEGTISQAISILTTIIKHIYNSLLKLWQNFSLPSIRTIKLIHPKLITTYLYLH